ncbi:MAG: hypothetical protein ABIL09_23945 [Gemmatimonadota bacterium]
MSFFLLRSLAVVLGLAAAAAAAPAEVELRFDAPDTVSWDTGESLVLSWLSVADSRCALDVVCVWEGEAKVGLGVAVDGAAADSVSITLGPAAEAFALVQGFRLQLLSVDPYPAVAGVEPARADYVARLQVYRPGETAVPGVGWGKVKEQCSGSE